MTKQFRQFVFNLLKKIQIRKFDIQNNLDSKTVIREWRATILNAFLTITVIVEIPVLAAILLNPSASQISDPITWIFTGSVLCLLVFVVFRRINYRVRVYAFLIISYAVMMVILITMGLRSLAPVCVLLISIFSLILFGKRTSIFVSALSAVILTIFTVLREQGLITLRSNLPGFLSPTVWADLSATLLILTSAMTLLILFYRLQEQIIDSDGFNRIKLIHALELLEQQNTDLEHKVKERTQELQMKNSQLAMAMDIAQLAYWEIDPSQNAFIFNDQFYALHHTSAEHEGGYVMPLDTYFSEFVHPDDIAAIQSKITEVLIPGNDLGYDEIDLRIICRGGEAHTHIVRLNIERNDVGAIIKITGAHQDITQRKRAEMELRESEEKLRLIFENAFDGISIYEEIPSEDRRVLLDCNERYCQMAGRSKQELMAIQDTRPIQRAIENAPETVHRESVIAERAFSGIISWIRPDGMENIIEYNAAPTRVGDRYLTIGLDRDITEHRRAEMELRESEEKLRLIFENAFDGISIYEEIPSEDRRILRECNERYCQMAGRSKEELLAIQDTRSVQVDLGEIGERFSWEPITSGRAFPGVFSWLRPDGRENIIEYNAAPARVGGRYFTVGLDRDVTERRQVEKDLKQAKEAAEAANRTKSTFLANMSHEIRTPMNAILGFTQLMQRDPDLSPRQREHLDVITLSGEHLLALINDILELSKIEAGRSTLTSTTFNLHKLLADLEVMFRVRTDERKLNLIFEIANEVPPWIMTDEGKLRQVLINLIGNAVKFTEEGGISIRIGIQAAESGMNCLRFEVEDTGRGISTEEMDKLFKPFEQTASGIKMGGTGLGLALCQRFVQVMGGTISVSSLPGKGSIFKFSIPYEEGEESISESKESRDKVIGLKPGQGEIRVLIADDRATNRYILAQMLSPVGFKLHEVSNGIEALEVVHSWNPQIILLDMRMPLMDGYQVLRKIKEDPKVKNTVIIAVTASAFQEDRQRIMASGADGYISKPFKESDLLETIRQLTGINYLYNDEVLDQQTATWKDPFQWQHAVSGIPGALVHECREAAENADIFRLLELTTAISAINTQVGQRLENLAKRYAYEEITNLLSSGE